jgi:predicted CopG family antitoxin
VTKTISLADDAYEALVGVKRPGESFSELARRIAKKEALNELLDPEREPLVSDEEAAAMLKAIYAARDASLEPRYQP